MDEEYVNIKIGVLVGSNGKASAWSVDGSMDWGLAADCIMNDDGTDPEVSKKYFVNISVPKPKMEEINAIAIEEVK